MKDRSISIYLRLLAHPLSLFACFLLLFNDFYLKTQYPSFLSGKLSDFAGLFLLPFLAGAVLSLAAGPLRISPRLILILALGIPGAAYTAAKIFPPFTQFLNALLSTRIIPDVSDLAALPVLAGSAVLWHTLRSRPVVYRRWQWAALPLVLLATLADMAAPDYGISCLRNEGTRLYAASTIAQRFVSTDGGLTWQTDTSEFFTVCQPGNFGAPPSLEDKVRGTLYEFPDESHVSVSQDGGATWTRQAVNTDVSQAEQAYIQLSSTGNPTLRPGILGAVIDPGTGNLVMALGHQGVLVREPSGTYVWADVGRYQHLSLARAGFSGFFTLLFPALLLSLLIALLAMRTWALKRDATAAQVTLTVLGWLLALIVGGLTLPGLIPYQSLASMVSTIAFGVGFLFLLGMNLLASSRMHEVTAWWTRLIPRALIIALVSWLFYVAWYLNWIPSYALAALLSAAWIVAAIIWQAARIPRAEVISN